MQELLGHRNVSTTMIYTHVLNKGGRGVRSPLDALLNAGAEGNGLGRSSVAHATAVAVLTPTRVMPTSPAYITLPRMIDGTPVNSRWRNDIRR